ncbi:unnamed protein product [Spirodela intermedia]|uniref:BHLH domain-containing protein n=1 Tax=Spirodela intermedia TaxID=51605 RepID=A0A7I8IUT3_SPIIN|nr:unnamed protein product [Spirodela intermedia]CAA6661382.1 unnamed protein product [Spirodela intermedia]
MMLQRPQLPTTTTRRRRQRLTTPSCRGRETDSSAAGGISRSTTTADLSIWILFVASLPTEERGDQSGVTGGLPNRGQYPFLGSASGCGDDERTTATSGGAAAAPAVGTRRKREACTLKDEGRRCRWSRSKLESPPISTITTAASDTCEGKSKASAPPGKSDYIHVRARRGQATDSHSLAERVRREKISKRMKILQDLVPGCSKIAGRLFLSMKLAAVSPTIDFGNIDALFGKQTSCNAHIDCDRRKSRRGWPHM